MKKLFKKKVILNSLIFSYLILFFCVNLHSYLLIPLFYEKVWIHRVNSIEKLKEVAPNFKGVELDIVYLKDNNTFDVNHPPTKSINLSLDKYLSSIKIGPENTFWLDFKNLSNANIKESFVRLEAILLKLKLKRTQFIVESKRPDLLGLFSKKGYKTCYYFPNNLNSSNHLSLKNQIKDLKQLIDKNKTDFISANFDHYKLLKEHFPNHKILIWFYKYSEKITINPLVLIKKISSIYQKYSILSDENVIIVLFSYNAKKGNR
jgi:hypothetical protein